MDTELYMVKRDYAGMTDRAKGIMPEKTGKIVSALAWGYALMILFPPVGCLAGVYLITKDETEHGIAVIVISIILSVFYFAGFRHIL